MNVFVYTADNYPADHRDRILARLREKHPAARVQRLDAGKADRILVFGDEPEFVRFFRKTGTPTVIYRPDGTFDTYDEALFLARLRTELDAVEIVNYAGRRHGGRTGFDERRNTSRVFGVPAGSADAAVEASREWRAEQAEKAPPKPPVVVNRSRGGFDVYIGRGSKWGNPFSHSEGTKAETVVETRDEAIERYREYLSGRPDLLDALAELTGKRLGCYCAPKPCHGDILVEAWASRFVVPEDEQLEIGGAA